ncbi:MAG: Flp pilus assembly complex ATPase component TadA [Planctomycetes bacterium]|nr:Flp pilus assembly complex ATPase component TadA [Planctomycetota bacterium]
MKRKLIGEILKERKVVTAEQVKEALKIQQEMSEKAASEKGDAKTPVKRIGEILIEKGWANQNQVTSALAVQHNLRFVRLSTGGIKEEIIQTVPKNIAMEHKIIPVTKKDRTLTIASIEPLDVFVLDNLRFLLNADLECVLTTPEEFFGAVTKYYGSVGSELDGIIGGADEGDVSVRKTDEDEEAGDDAPIIKLVQMILADAVKNRVSDIHIEPMEKELRIRYRIDGMCVPIESPPKRLQGSLLSRVKLMSGMDIAEKRKPQDGRIPLILNGKNFDIRVSALPSSHGESIVMRLLEKEALVTLEELGFHSEDYQKFRSIIKKPNGIFLVTGPTGSGKTTTLYAALKELNKPNVKIITAEDPVEYVLPGINQCRVKTDIGFTFASIIRAMLRQAPNIILVGEIRDLETAEIAIQAALTGHLVFSTLHTNDAPSSLTRLLDMGVKPFLVSTSIQAILAQRLVRVLCPKCKQPYQPTQEELAALGLSEKDIAGKTIYQAIGCKECKDSGYKGRKGLFELMEMNSTIREMTFQKESTLKLREQAIMNGMVNLLHDGVRKVLDGITTVEEVLLMTKREDIAY